MSEMPVGKIEYPRVAVNPLMGNGQRLDSMVREIVREELAKKERAQAHIRALRGTAAEINENVAFEPPGKTFDRPVEKSAPMSLPLGVQEREELLHFLLSSQERAARGVGYWPASLGNVLDKLRNP